MFSGLWLLSNPSFSVSMSAYLFFDHPLAGCACLFCSCCSIDSPLPFPRDFACLLAVLYLVVHVFALLVAE